MNNKFRNKIFNMLSTAFSYFRKKVENNDFSLEMFSKFELNVFSNTIFCFVKKWEQKTMKSNAHLTFFIISYMISKSNK